MPNYKALIFDLGNVLFHYNAQNILIHLSFITRRPLAEVKALLAEHAEQSYLFHKGLMTETEFRLSLSKRLQAPILTTEFIRAWNSIFLAPLDNMDKMLPFLKQHYRLVTLSDTNITHQRAWEIRYADLLSHFEKTFSSHEIKAHKPEPEAFQAVLDYLQLPPSEVVFLDDKATNVAGAAALGITGIQVTSAAQMQADLAKLLGVGFDY